ncbi:MAG: discoidin domain-containing protein, partial [Clostridia bacterium]|nr:discoidin domain-containing protein [Clostridia bacterium]
LLLALILVLTVAVLASCGKTGEESKPVESAVESKEETAESKEESKEESKAEESKAEESVEESEPEEPSEEEIPSAAEPDLDGTNVALGKEYTLSGAVNETYNAKLTDGKAYDEAVTNAVDPDDGLCYWCGFNSANVTDGYAVVTIDLGEATSINTVRVHHGVLADWAVMPWKSFKFSVSTDGANFTAVAALPQGETDNGTFWAEAGFEAVEARYVKVELELNPAWGFINEIEVYSAD